MDEMRQMLDQLMGQDRNLSTEEKKRHRPKTRSYRDKDVCKYYLCGFCPYTEFRRTKNDCGDCPCIHDEDAKREWDGLDDKGKERTGYEDELKKWMDRLLGDLQKRINTNTERLKITEKPLFLAEDQQRMDSMAARIEELLAQSQALGEQGDVDGSQQALSEAEQVKVQRSAFEQQCQSRAGNNAAKNMQQAVCPLSGLIINKEESRIQDHLSGRNYNSWKKLHEVYAQLGEIAKRREEGRMNNRHERDRRDAPEARPSHRDRDGRGGARDERRESRHREPRDRERELRELRRPGERERERDRDRRNRRERDREVERDDRGRGRESRERERDDRGREREERDRRDQDRRDGRERVRSPVRPSRSRDLNSAGGHHQEEAAAAGARREAAAGGAHQVDATDWGVDYGPAKPM